MQTGSAGAAPSEGPAHAEGDAATRGVVLVTGATGYIGSRLIPLLLGDAQHVRVLVRSTERLARHPFRDDVDVIEGDASDPEALERALKETTVAYYLLHSVNEGKNLEDAEERTARAFADAARRAGTRRIVYLGGLGPDEESSELSPHMRSRGNVGEILRASGVPTCELRASIVIGSGSTSFEMLRHLTERLPLMVTPRWVRQKTQPIAIRDVLHYLNEARQLPESVNAAFDIGGPDILSYQDTMQAYARAAGLRRRVILPINLLTPKLSSHWVGVVTPVPAETAKPLVASLKHPSVCRDRTVDQHISPPAAGKTPLSIAIAEALGQTTQGNDTGDTSAAANDSPATPKPGDPPWSGPTHYADQRSAIAEAGSRAAWEAIADFGKDGNYYSNPYLWRARLLLDRLGRAGGAKSAEGRRAQRNGRNTQGKKKKGNGETRLWRTIATTPAQSRKLESTLTMPGTATLTHSIHDVDGKHTRITQTAHFATRGLGGILYWQALKPFHAVIFPQMLANMAKEAEARSRATRAPDQ